MKEATKAKLDGLFEKLNDRKRSEAEAQQVKESKEDLFLKQFKEVQDRVIRPAMEEIGAYIKSKGFDYQVLVEDDRISKDDGRRRYVPASITFVFYPDQRGYPTHAFPGLTVICEKTQQRVRFHESTISPGRGGYTGGAGETALSELTASLIQSK